MEIDEGPAANYDDNDCFFECRFCHDESVVGHAIDRFKVNEVMCKECGCRQKVSE